MNTPNTDSGYGDNRDQFEDQGSRVIPEPPDRQHHHQKLSPWSPVTCS